LATEAIRKYEESEIEGDYKKRIQAAFSKPNNFGSDLNATLKYRREEDLIEILTKNILRHKLNEEDLKVFLIQNALDDQETKKDLKMQDLKTFDEIKTQIVICNKVKKKLR